MNGTFRVQEILRSDPYRWHLLDVVRSLGLPDCWIGAGFVRNAVWDCLHQRTPSPPTGDVDVIWHDHTRSSAIMDRQLEALLCAAAPGIHWSVKNQARMHGRNGDDPYTSSVEAVRYWPETATAIAMRRLGLDECEVAAPWGLDDLLALVLRPTPCFRSEKRSIYEQRLRTKNWIAFWPRLQIEYC